jgi:hypothetical protein
LYLGELFNILKILESQNIKAIPYKGPVLAITSYKDISLREFVDIDIFVSKNNIPKLKTILISRGYKPQIQLTGLQEKIYLNSQRDYQFNNPQNNTNIEIHWNFIGLSFTYPTDNFSNPKNLKHIQIHNRDVLSLSSEDTLLVLCIHASGHLWERLSWICDISEFIQSNEDINWENLIEKSEKLGFKRILQINIMLAMEILGLKLSEKINEKLDMDNQNLKNLCFNIKRDIFNFDRKDEGIIHNTVMRTNIRERKKDQIQDFFKIILSHIMIRFYTIF